MSYLCIVHFGLLHYFFQLDTLNVSQINGSEMQHATAECKTECGECLHNVSAAFCLGLGGRVKSNTFLIGSLLDHLHVIISGGPSKDLVLPN